MEPDTAETVKRLARTKAEYLLLYRDEPASIELTQAIDRIHAEAKKFGILIDDIDAEALPTLKRNHFFVHNEIRPIMPVEDMVLCDILMVWLAIHAEGRIRIDTTQEIHLGTIGSWAEWSGSQWVTARMRRIQERGVKCHEAHFHCSFPPSREPETERDHEIVRTYGRWLTETHWVPPPDWDDDVKEAFVNACSFTYFTMTIDQVLKAWRGIYAEGGLKIDTTRYIPGVSITWAQWSGSRWVAKMEQQYRDAEPDKPLPKNSTLHFAFAPGEEPITGRDRDLIRENGRWVSETEWDFPDYVKANVTATPQIVSQKATKWWQFGWRKRWKSITRHGPH